MQEQKLACKSLCDVILSPFKLPVRVNFFLDVVLHMDKSKREISMRFKESEVKCIIESENLVAPILLKSYQDTKILQRLYI